MYMKICNENTCISQNSIGFDGISNILLAFCLKTGLKQSLSVAGAFSQKGHFLSGKPDHFQHFTFQAGWAAWAAEAWFGQLWIFVQPLLSDWLKTDQRCCVAK